MRKLLWYALLVGPAILVSYWLPLPSVMSAKSNAYALEVPTKRLATKDQKKTATTSTSKLHQSPASKPQMVMHASSGETLPLSPISPFA